MQISHLRERYLWGPAVELTFNWLVNAHPVRCRSPGSPALATLSQWQRAKHSVPSVTRNRSHPFV